MAIDIEHEILFRLPGEGHKLLPDPPSAPTWWRWAVKGVRGRRLETVILGGKRYTSAEALARFAQHQGGADAPIVRSPRQRDRAIRKAEDELGAAGI